MKKNKFTAWACVSTRGIPFLTCSSRKPENIGRYEIYETRQQALDNSIFDMIRKVTITVSTEEESQ